MRTRRTFTKQFKNETSKRILTGLQSMEVVSKERNISIPLLQRWVNDYVAQNRSTESTTNGATSERRKDFQTTQELKAKIADLYMYIEKLQRSVVPYSNHKPLQKEA